MALIEHLEKLRHFYRISQHNSINATATHTGLSQAGLSKSLSLLENELSCKLFIRSRDGLTLTKEGLELLKVTENILAEAATIENRLRSLQSTKSPKKIRIGMYDSIAVYLGVELQKYLREIYPKVSLILTADTSFNLHRKIQNADIDIAIGVNYHRLENRNLHFHLLFDDYYSAYQSVHHNNSSFIVHESASDENGCLLREILKAEFKNEIVHSVQNFETLKQLTVSGFGIGILPRQVAHPLLKQGVILPLTIRSIKSFFGKHKIGVLIRKEIFDEYTDFITDIIRLGHRPQGG